MEILDITDKITGGLPNILKYGVVGLSAIVFLLAYSLLKTQNNRPRPSAPMLTTIKSFMWIALVFALVSAISTFAEGYFINRATDRLLRSDDDKNSRTATLVDFATEIISSDINKINSKHQFRDGIVTKGNRDDQYQGIAALPAPSIPPPAVDQPAQDLHSPDIPDEHDGPGSEGAAPPQPYSHPPSYHMTPDSSGNNNLGNSFHVHEDYPYSSFSQEINESELQYRILKQAIFLNIYPLDADKEILDSVLYRISLRTYYPNEVLDRIKMSFNHILREKLTWLHSTAIPNQARQREKSKGVVQGSGITSPVELPESVWIFDSYPPDNRPRISLGPLNRELMTSELEAIKRKLK